MTIPDQKAELLESWLAAWNGHDAERLASFLAPDAVYEDVVMGVVTHSREDARAYFTASFEAFPDLRMELDTAIATETGGAIEWQFSGTQRTDIPGYPGVGNLVSVRGVTTMVFGDNRISRVRDYCELSAGTGIPQQLEAAVQA